MGREPTNNLSTMISAEELIAGYSAANSADREVLFKELAECYEQVIKSLDIRGEMLNRKLNR